jgi:hypothetical protein
VVPPIVVIYNSALDLQNKEDLNTDLQIMGVGVLLRLHAQHDAPRQIVTRRWDALSRRSN